jgi:hypothetical protein
MYVWTTLDVEDDELHGPFETMATLRVDVLRSGASTVQVGKWTPMAARDYISSFANADYMLEMLEDAAEEDTLNEDYPVFDMDSANVKEAEKELRTFMEQWLEKWVTSRLVVLTDMQVMTFVNPA